MKLREFFLSIGLILTLTANGIAQYNDKGYEIGVEIAGAQGSNLGGMFGGVVKFAITEDMGFDNSLAYGPSLRYQYIWSNNTFTGVQGSSSMFGFGGFIQYRFFEWFYLGSEVEIIQNRFSAEANWTPVGFLGGGIHKDFGGIKLNAGLMYDAIDALRAPTSPVSSPLFNSYFIRVQNPTSPGQAGGFLPIIARITFFFELGN